MKNPHFILVTLVVMSTGSSSLVSAAANDTINGTVVDSVANTGVDSVMVSSEGVSVLTASTGAFKLVVPGTAVLTVGQKSQDMTVAWDPKGNFFSWTENARPVLITVQNLLGRVVAKNKVGNAEPEYKLSLINLPQGVYLATITMQSAVDVYKIMKFQAGTNNSCKVVSHISGNGRLAKSLATTKVHVVVFKKTGYKPDTITVAANTSTATVVAAKLVQVKTYTVLFDGTNLDNWVVNPTNCYIKDSAIYITGCWCMMWTKLDYDNFRVFVTCRITDPNYTNPGSNHMGIGIWGTRANDFSPTRSIEFTPQNCWIWDYVSNTGPNNAQTCYAADGTGPSTGWGDWHTTELLANLTDGTVKTACDGEKMTHYKEPNLSRRHKGPIGLQMHGPVPVEYKDIKIEVNPTDTNLVSVTQ